MKSIKTAISAVAVAGWDSVDEGDTLAALQVDTS